MVRVRLLGELTVEVDGRRRELPPGRPAELFAWLALNPGLHPRSTVAGRFWPDVLDASARASLRSAVWAIRRVLGSAAEAALVATRDRIGLANGETVWVDAHDVELLARGDGELLPGIDEEWAHEAREELRRRRVEWLGDAARQAEDAGEAVRALALTRQQAELDPLSEPVHRDLLRRLAESGDAAAAVAAHAAFRTRMLATLRIGPSAETERVAEQIRRRGETGERELPAPLRRADRDPFVGREPQLQRLRALWTRVAIGKGRAQLALLSGEPGIGKTRLAARFAREVHEAGGVVLYGACLETALRPYEPFAEALSAPLQGTEAVAAAEHRLSELAATAPVLLVVDDLHWSDRATLALLGQLVRTGFAGRLAVLGAYRDTGATHPQLREALSDLRRHADIERLRLEGLPEEDVRKLLAAGTETGAVADEAPSIRRRTDGNPFFVRELARHLAEGDGSDVPDAIREVVAARVGRMPEPCAEILSTASVLGDPFPLDLLAEVAGVDEDAVVDRLDEAAEAGLVEELAPASYAFVHSLTRDSVYLGLSRTRRALLHLRTADALERRYGVESGPQLGAIAMHLLDGAAAGDRERAVDTGCRAAAAAEEQQAYEQAVTMYTRTLQLVAESDVELRRRLTVRRAVAYQRMWHALLDAPAATTAE